MYEENACSPPLPAPPSVTTITLADQDSFPQYRLLATGPGHTGCPVLFVPGDAQWERVALLTKHSDRAAPRLDFFVADIGGPGLTGPTLLQQTEFLCSCLTRILEKYNPPTTVVLVGAGQGALLAQAGASHCRPGLVLVTVSLAAPLAPPLLLDRQLEQFYALAGVGGGVDTRVSLGGGGGRPGEVHLDCGPVWCGDSLARLHSALRAALGSLTKQVSLDPAWRRERLQEELLGGAGEQQPGPVRLTTPAYWTDILPAQWSVEKGSPSCDHYSAVRLGGPGPRYLAVSTSPAPQTAWLLGCTETAVHRATRVCTRAESLAGSGPGRVRLDLQQLQPRYESVLVHSQPGVATLLSTDRHGEERELEVEPGWGLLLRGSLLVESTAPGALWYRVSLAGATQLPAWLSLQLRAEPLCSPALPALLVASPPGRQTENLLQLSADRPAALVHLQPGCRYRLALHPALPAAAVKLLGRVAPLLPTTAVSALLLALAAQLTTPRPPPTSFALSSLSPVTCLLPARLAALLLGLAGVPPQLPPGPLPLLALLLLLPPAWLVSTLLQAGVETAASLLSWQPPSPLPALLLLLPALATLLSGPLALVLGCLVHLAGLVRLQQAARDEVKLHCTLVLIQMVTAALHGPALLVWLASPTLAPDSSMLPALCLTGAVAVLLSSPGPPPSSPAPVLIHCLTALLLPLAASAVYRLSFAVSAVFVSLATHRLLAGQPAAPPAYLAAVWCETARLPAQFLTDLAAVLVEAWSGLACMLTAVTRPARPTIKVVPATPDYDYLPDNHPLRRLKLPPQEEEEEVAGQGLVSRLLLAVARFHWGFYDDLLTTLTLGCRFLVSLPGTLASCGAAGRALAALKLSVTVINSAVQSGGEWARELASRQQSEADTTGTHAVEVGAAKTISKEKPHGVDHSIPENPRVAEKIGRGKIELPEHLVKGSKITDLTSPVKSIEAFKSEVKIQEEILKIGKDKARELFADPVLVSGPWLQDRQTIVPGYQEIKQETLPEKEDFQLVEPFESKAVSPSIEKTFEEKKIYRPEFNEPLPTSSIFERDLSKQNFDLKTKVSSRLPSPAAEPEFRGKVSSFLFPLTSVRPQALSGGEGAFTALCTTSTRRASRRTRRWRSWSC